jgi:NAD(P)-dependent dehydrogenase (short-subunit alcohol dehydrogenase family)
MKSVVVTGGSGKAGRATIRELLEHGYEVMNVDAVAPAEPLCHFMKADLNDLGQAMDALRLLPGTIDRRAVGGDSSRGHSGAGPRARRHHLPEQHDDDLQRVQRRLSPPSRKNIRLRRKAATGWQRPCARGWQAK